MKCQILFSGKNKKNISKCRLLKILPRVLSVKQVQQSINYLLASRMQQFSPEAQILAWKDIKVLFEVDFYRPLLRSQLAG